MNHPSPTQLPQKIIDKNVLNKYRPFLNLSSRRMHKIREITGSNC